MKKMLNRGGEEVKEADELVNGRERSVRTVWEVEINWKNAGC